MQPTTVNNIYIHVPFCNGKCDYCSFYSTIFSEYTADYYLDALTTEIDLYLEKGYQLKPRTIYIGGGTPSTLTVRQIKQLNEIITARIDSDRLTEWTIEINPGNITEEFIDTIVEYGINRVSIGAQSFNDNILKKIGRRHTAQDIKTTIEIIKKYGIENYNIDLISALPGVSEKIWQQTLQTATELHPTHIAIYNFSIEPGTLMEQRRKQGLIMDSDANYQLKMLQIAEETIENYGYRKYEISNFSLPGYQSQHNLACWKGKDYIGFGPAASSRIGLKRWHNISDINSYIKHLTEQKSPIAEQEILTKEIDTKERLMFAFRLTEGIDINKFATKHNLSETMIEKIRNTLQHLIEEGKVTKRNNRYYPTKSGLNFADYIAQEIITID